jgi:hypothetical protein
MMEPVERFGASRQCLDQVGVPGRLVHVRDYVWRGGTLRFVVDGATAGYKLRADWDAPVLATLGATGANGLELASKAVIDGQWTRGTAGYQLMVGIDVGAPWAITIRSDRLLATVPCVRRPQWQVEHALAADLEAYVEHFLSTCEPVPIAAANAEERLRVAGVPAQVTRDR